MDRDFAFRQHCLESELAYFGGSGRLRECQPLLLEERQCEFSLLSQAHEGAPQRALHLKL
jgi:hypothetical protein